MRRGSVYAASALMAFFLLQGFVFQPVYGAEGTSRERIVLAADVSGSMADMDPSGSMKDALSLAVGLAPEGAEMALLSVNTGVQTETEFYDTSSAEGRRLLRTAVDGLAYQGNTDLVYGLQHAVEKLDGHGRIILLADISEGGLTPADTAGASGQAALAEELAARCASSGITVDLILMGQAPQGNDLAAAIEEIAAKTGGHILRPESGDELAGCIEELYFSSYSYLKWPISGTGLDSIPIPVLMPTEHVHRARIYIPAAGKVQAAYAGAGLEAENRAAFSLLDLSRPAREGVTLTVEHGEGFTEIVLITDYRLELSVVVSSEVLEPEKRGEEARQHTVITLDILDRETGKSILDTETARYFTPEIALAEPGGAGHNPDIEITAEGKYTASVYPEHYGTYTITVTLSKGELSLPSVHASFEIEDVRPVEKSWRLSTLIAVLAGGILIVLAMIFAWRRRGSKTSSVRQGAVELAPVQGFTGRLSILPVLVNSGEKQVRPLRFNLGDLRGEHKITLEKIYEASGISSPFEAAGNVLFLPGPGGSLIVKNNGGCTLRAAGKEYSRGQKLQLYYGDKLFLIFEPDVDEAELYYRQAEPSLSSGHLVYSMQQR